MFANLKGRITERRAIRLSALLPFVLSLLAFPLQVITLLSGRTLNEFNMLSLNTSKLGQNVVSFSPVTKTSNGIAPGVKEKRLRHLHPLCNATRNGTAATAKERKFKPRDAPCLLSNISLPATNLSSAPLIVSTPTQTNLTNQTTPTTQTTQISLPLPSATALPLSSINSNTLLLTVLTTMNGLFANVPTEDLDVALNNTASSLIQGSVAQFGIAQYYTVHVGGICSGSFTNGKFIVQNYSSSYGDHSATTSSFSKKLSTSIPVGSTNMSIPILGEFSAVALQLNNLLSTLEKVSLASHILALIGTGATLSFSLFAMFYPSQSKLIHLNVFASYLGSTFQFGSAIMTTVILVVASSTINRFGSHLGVEAHVGAKYLAVSWFSATFMLIASTYWDIVWFVEFRETAITRRRRTEAEMGNYRGILREVRNNWKTPPPLRDERLSGLHDLNLVSKYSSSSLEELKGNWEKSLAEVRGHWQRPRLHWMRRGQVAEMDPMGLGDNSFFSRYSSTESLVRRDEMAKKEWL